MRILDRLQTLMHLPAPSGYEQAVALQMTEWFVGKADEVTTDQAGNVTGVFPGTNPDAPSIMVFAHMDQIGFVVRMIDSDGFLSVERLGGIPIKVLPGLRLLVMTDKGQWIPGVIGNKSHHVTPADEKMNVRDIDGLYVDIGAKSRDEVEALGVGAGNPCVYRPSCECLGENRLCGTSIDNRGGCAVLAALAEDLAMHPRPATVYLVATVQEEFNLRGATLAARRLLPDIAVCLDMAVTGDTPDLWNRFEPALGTGPALGMYYFHGRGTLNGVIAHRGLVNLTISTAKRLHMQLPRLACVGLVTDAAYVQLEGNGIATIDLGFPVRNTHTPTEICDCSDLEDLTRLVLELVSSIDTGFHLSRF